MVSEQSSNVRNPSVVKNNVTNKKNEARKREVEESEMVFLKFPKEVSRSYARLKHNFKKILTLPQCHWEN